MAPFQTLKQFGKTLFFLVSLIALVAAVKVSAEEETGRLFDAAKWLEQQKALSTKEVMALRDLITIQYDESLGRPWGEPALTEQIQKRWTDFREYFCPAVKEVCLLSPQTQLKNISALLKKDESIQQINEQLKKLNSPLQLIRLRTVPGRLPDELGSLDGFNFVLGIITPEKSQDGRTYFKVDQTVLQDVGTYYLSYQNKLVYNYLAFGKKGELLVFEETFIGKALELAPHWQKAVKSKVEEDFIYLPARLTKEYAESKKSFSARYRQLADLQGFEWLIYDEIKTLTISVGLDLIRCLSKNGDIVDAGKILLQSLVQLQKDFDPRWVGLLYFQQTFDQNALVLEQFVPPTTINTLIRENLHALLSIDKYASTKQKNQALESLPLSLLQDEDFLKGSHQTLHEVLLQMNAMKLDWSSLPVEHKRLLMIAYVYPLNVDYASEVKSFDQLLVNSKNIDISKVHVGMYRAFAALLGAKDLKLFSHLADQIYERRFPSL